MTILILGGGASGMMAALTAAEAGCRVILAERQARVGRKLLATGNGRCNLTNLHAAPEHYHGTDPDFCRPALAAFGPEAALDFFAGLGLLTVAESSGRVYPFSDQANSVLDVLRFGLEQRGVELHTGCEAKKIWKRRDGWLLKTTGGDFTGEKLIVAAGGMAGGKLGGTDLGYRLLEDLGHHRTPLAPVLVQLVTAGTVTRALKGIRAQGSVAVRRGRQTLAESRGEIQFTETGVSGPAVFEVSRAAATGGSGLTVVLNLLPQMAEDQIRALLLRRQADFPERPAEDLLTGMLHNRLGKTLVKAAGIAADAPLSALSGSDLDRVVSAITAFTLELTGTQGMDNAQVTAGGMDTSEFDPNTLESRLHPGLYACGEVLDVDGDCGGYNLQWAWASGHLAAQSASKEVQP